MKTLGAVAMTVCAITFLAACGSSDDGGDQPTAVTAAAIEAPEQPTGSLDKAALVKAADANCEYEWQLRGRLGPAGKIASGIAAQWSGTVPVMEEVQGLQSDLQVDPSVKKTWEEYLKANQAYIDSLSEITTVSTDEEAGAKSAAANEVAQATYPPADELGLEVCTFTPEATVEKTEMENPASLDLPEPSNTVDEAADTFMAALNGGDCEKLNATINSDVGTLPAGDCQYLFDSFANLDVAGSQSLGPVAYVELKGKGDDPRAGTMTFVIDGDGVLKYSNNGVIIGGGIHPPSEGFDSQETMDAAIVAIRDEDGQAFLDIQGPDSAITEVAEPFEGIGDSEGGKVIAAAIRDNPDVEPMMIGANQLEGAFIFDTGEEMYLLQNGHFPGSETAYGNFGYWLLPSS